MSTLRNKVQLIGHLGGNPEIKNFDSGKKLATFSLATTENYIGKNGERLKETQWHQIICWGKQADITEKYLSKGKEVLLEGKITYETWEDKEGIKKNSTKIVVHEIILLGN